MFPVGQFEVLHRTFGSGISVRELQSVAIVIANMAEIKGPSRVEKRNCAELVKWFTRSWDTVLSWLPLIQLRDEEDRVIDGCRELSEKGFIRLVNF
jgi:hypothetical protein